MNHLTTASLLALCLANPLEAEEFLLASNVIQADLFPAGAIVRREVEVTLPEGAHEIIVADLPDKIALQDIRINAGEPIQVVSARLTQNGAFVGELPDSPAVAKTRAELHRLEAELADAKRQTAAVDGRIDGARSILSALERLQIAPLLSTEPGMSATQQVLETAQQANIELQTALAERAPLQVSQKEIIDRLSNVRKKLEELYVDPASLAQLHLSVKTQSNHTGTIEIEYLSAKAGWQPVYDIRLDRQTGRLQIDHGAVISQQTGEFWHNVDVTVSTSQPDRQTVPAQLWPWLVHSFEPGEYGAKSLDQRQFGSARVSELAVAPAVEMAMAPKIHVTEGISVKFDPPGSVTLPSGRGSSLITLASDEFEAEVYARAVPARDQTAFMVAMFENKSELPLLGAPANYYLDGAFVAQRYMESLAPGEEREVSFTPIQGLQLSVEERGMQGDIGLIGRKNQRERAVTYKVENLTDLPWPVRLLGQVPYSEQEELEVSWTATPEPDVIDFDTKQGVLEWRLAVEPGEERDVQLNYELRWPQDHEIR